MSGINSSNANKSFNDFMGSNINIAGKEVKVGDVIKYTGKGSFGAVGQFCSRLVVSLKLGTMIDNKKLQGIGKQIANKFGDKLADNMEAAIQGAKDSLDGKTLKKLESASKKFIEFKGENIPNKIDISVIKEARKEVKAVRSLMNELGKISPEIVLGQEGPVRAAFYKSVSKGGEPLTPGNVGKKYQAFVDKELGPLLLKKEIDLDECTQNCQTLSRQQQNKVIDSLGFQTNLQDGVDLKTLIENANKEIKPALTNEQAKADFDKLKNTNPLHIKKENEPLFSHMTAWADKSQKGDIFNYTASIAKLNNLSQSDNLPNKGENSFKNELRIIYNTYLKESSGSVFSSEESSQTLNISSESSFDIDGQSMSVGEARKQIDEMLQPNAEVNADKAMQILEGVLLVAIDDKEQVYRNLLNDYKSSLK